MEVNDEGNTTTHVFQGMVKVEVASISADRRSDSDGTVVLRTDETARVERDKDAAIARLLTDVKIADPGKFVRRMPRLSGINNSALVKDSADFTWKYEMNVDPTTQDLDGNRGPDWRRHQGAVQVNGDGTVTLDYLDGSSGCLISAGPGDAERSPSHVWNNITTETGYTVELRIKAGGKVDWHGHTVVRHLA